MQLHPKLAAVLEQHDHGGLHDGAGRSVPAGDRWPPRPQVTVPRRLPGESVHGLPVWGFSSRTLWMEQGGNLKAGLIIKYLSLNLAFSSGGIDLLASTQ